MPSAPCRRLEDRIRELSLQLAYAQELAFPDAISNLQIALNEFAQLQTVIAEFKRRFGNKTTTNILTWPGFPRDRRRASGTENTGIGHERKKEAQKTTRQGG